MPSSCGPRKNDEEERIALDSFGLLQKVVVGLGAQDVHGDFGDRLAGEGAEADGVGSCVLSWSLALCTWGSPCFGRTP